MLNDVGGWYDWHKELHNHFQMANGTMNVFFGAILILTSYLLLRVNASVKILTAPKNRGPFGKSRASSYIVHRNQGLVWCVVGTYIWGFGSVVGSPCAGSQ